LNDSRISCQLVPVSFLPMGILGKNVHLSTCRTQNYIRMLNLKAFVNNRRDILKCLENLIEEILKKR
jgi:hypothetical protein